MDPVSAATCPTTAGEWRPASRCPGRGRSLPARSFTAIELLIVIVIVAIAASLVIPMIGGTSTIRLRAAARMLVADLEFAQIESMAHTDDPRLFVIEGSTTYRIAPTSNSISAIVNPADGDAYRVVYGTGRAAELVGVVISAFSLGGDDRLGFGRYGQLDQAAAATITLAASGETVTVTLDPETGEATVGPVG